MIQIPKIHRYFIAIKNSTSSFIQNLRKGVRLLIATVLSGIFGFSLVYLINHELVSQGIKLILTVNHLIISKIFTLAPEVLSLISKVVIWLISFQPNLDFISDIIAYQAAVIAIAIPLSLEIISRISERYHSGVITKEFNKQWQFRVLLILVFIDACLGVTFNFFVNQDPSLFWRLTAWFIYFLFVVTNFVLVAYFDALRKYAAKTNFLLNQLSSDLAKSVNGLSVGRTLKDYHLTICKNRFIDALEGIGDVLVFEAKQKRNEQRIIDGFRYIQTHGQKLFSIQKTDSNRLRKILYSDDLLQTTDKVEASLQLRFFPKKHSIALTAITNQFLRVREAAIDSRNLEIARLATYNLVWLLKHLSQLEEKPEISDSIQVLLGILNHLRYEAEKGEEYLEDFINVNWYLSVVFEDDFNLQFITPFNQDFRQCMRRVIFEGNDRIFRGLVESLNYSSSIQYYSIYTLESFNTFLMGLDHEAYRRANKHRRIDARIRELSAKEKYINRFDVFRVCIDLLQEIRELSKPYLRESDQDKLLDEIDEINKSLCFRFKLNCLVEILFDLGAYCVFKEKFDCIYLLLTYRQPKDADANWLGRDLMPTSLERIFGVYFQQNLFYIYSPSDWDGHHGKSRYYRLYVLILFLYAFSKSGSINENSYNTLTGQFRLPKELDAQQLNEITNFISSKLLPSLEDLQSIQDGLQLLGLEEIDLLIREGLRPFLLQICEQISFRMEELIRSTKISINKIDIFRANFVSGYKKVISFVDLFFYLGKYEEKDGLDPEGTEPILFGFSEVTDKVIFFEDWYLESDHLGEQYGQRLARSKDSVLLEKIMESCQVSEETDLDQVISRFHQDPSELIIHWN